MQLEEIALEASKLSEEQRASLASRLLNSLERPHHRVSGEEVAERISEAEKDSSVLLSFDEFVRGIKRSGS